VNFFLLFFVNIMASHIGCYWRQIPTRSVLQLVLAVVALQIWSLWGCFRGVRRPPESKKTTYPTTEALDYSFGMSLTCCHECIWDRERLAN
jgi:hypothetical protein